MCVWYDEVASNTTSSAKCKKTNKYDIYDTKKEKGVEGLRRVESQAES